MGWIPGAQTPGLVRWAFCLYLKGFFGVHGLGHLAVSHATWGTCPRPVEVPFYFSFSGGQHQDLTQETPGPTGMCLRDAWSFHLWGHAMPKYQLSGVQAACLRAWVMLWNPLVLWLVSFCLKYPIGSFLDLPICITVPLAWSLLCLVSETSCSYVGPFCS